MYPKSELTDMFATPIAISTSIFTCAVLGPLSGPGWLTCAAGSSFLVLLLTQFFHKTYRRGTFKDPLAQQWEKELKEKVDLQRKIIQPEMTERFVPDKQYK